MTCGFDQVCPRNSVFCQWFKFGQYPKARSVTVRQWCLATEVLRYLGIVTCQWDSLDLEAEVRSPLSGATGSGWM
eukprot:1641839-Rhodomonas_salina.1